MGEIIELDAVNFQMHAGNFQMYTGKFQHLCREVSEKCREVSDDQFLKTHKIQMDTIDHKNPNVLLRSTVIKKYTLTSVERRSDFFF